jgi:hypothetical protein
MAMLNNQMVYSFEIYKMGVIFTGPFHRGMLFHIEICCKFDLRGGPTSHTGYSWGARPLCQRREAMTKKEKKQLKHL